MASNGDPKKPPKKPPPPPLPPPLPPPPPPLKPPPFPPPFPPPPHPNPNEEPKPHSPGSPGTPPVPSSKNETIEMIEVSPEEKINIKKEVKYKEINEMYIKGEVLGKGSFAKVRECIDKKSLKRYAVKIMKKDVLKRMGSNVKLNVQKEMQMVSKLSHKNIMEMIDKFENEKNIYIFMEFCAGILTEILDKAPNGVLPKWECHHYFCQLIDGLKYLHSKGIYHRDIKDENLLVDNWHVIKIADFGVSFETGPFAEDDMIGGYEGSALFQPPDILDERYSGSKFDIWSSGVVLFKMVTGLYPFFNKNEDVFKRKSWDGLEYPDIIKEDKQLLDLMKNLLNVNFVDRITIRGIKNHPWIQLKHRTESDQYTDFVIKSWGDIYRGMTLLERLRVKYEFDIGLKKTEPEWVDEKEYLESAAPKNPNVRGSRVQVKREKQKKTVVSRKVNTMGLLAGISSAHES